MGGPDGAGPAKRFGVPPCLKGVALDSLDIGDVNLDEITLPKGENFGIISDEARAQGGREGAGGRSSTLIKQLPKAPPPLV